MKAFDNLEIWWVTGAQLLYGGDAVVAVDGHSKEMVEGLNNSGIIPIKVVYKGTANSSKEVEDVMKAANNDEKCVGIITWMHTFSPAKMWIISAPVCVFLARWFVATGRMKLLRSRLPFGLVWLLVLLMPRTYAV